MTNETNDAYEILVHNVGFSDRFAWIDTAMRLGFKRVKAARIKACPDCGGPTRALQMGQYVYYSTLHRLHECQCGLIYADAQVDPAVLSQHFEGAYKDEGYFRKRLPIFRSLARLIDRVTPHQGSMLDVGGATGHLIIALSPDRFDIRYALSDLSETACAQAKYMLQLAPYPVHVSTYVGTVPQLPAQTDRQFDTVVCSDVLYYESDVRGMWDALSKIVAPGGTLIIRVPNKLWYIRLRQWWFRYWTPIFDHQLQTDLPGFNPEHRTILTQSYLRDRLRQAGFTQVEVRTSPPLLPSFLTAFAPILGALGQLVAWCTRGRVIPTPAMVLVATKS